MGNNKVSEKAVWEGSISPDNNTSSIASQMQAQPQMMFCYKCNNVIPANSKFCPCCKTELYTVCPKCGVKYSTQYQICNQCGTDRQEYLQLQRKEQERKAAREQENRRRQEILEREKREKERQEKLKQYEQQVSYRQQKHTYIAENKEIIKTAEYISLHSLFTNAFTAFNKRCNIMMSLFVWGPFILSMIYLVFAGLVYDLANKNFELFITIIVILYISILLGGIVQAIYRYSTSCRKHYLMKYIFSRKDYDKSMVTTYLIEMVNDQGIERLEDCCIIAYRKKHKLPINFSWHSLTGSVYTK